MSKVLDSVQAWDVRPMSQAYQMSKSIPAFSDDHTAAQGVHRFKQEASKGGNGPNQPSTQLSSPSVVLAVNGALSTLTLQQFICHQNVTFYLWWPLTVKRSEVTLSRMRALT